MHGLCVCGGMCDGVYVCGDGLCVCGVRDGVCVVVCVMVCVWWYVCMHGLGVMVCMCVVCAVCGVCA